MTERPTLQDGQIWRAEYANAAGYPQMTGLEVYGHGPLIRNENLSNDQDQIKVQFYSWQQRILIIEGSGLQVSYSGTSVMLTDGSTVAINAGTLDLPDDSTGFIYINESGAVANSPNLPQVCVPLAYYVTASGGITTLADLRYQAIETVRPVSIDATSIFSIGDIKESARVTPEAGWLLCDGSNYAIATYPLLYDAIGTTYNQQGDPLGTFRVPDCRGRTSIGAGQGVGLSNRALGGVLGAERHRLSVSEMPSHNHSASGAPHVHGINDPGHAHGLNDSGHSHGISIAPHTHGVIDPGHTHNLTVNRNDGTGNHTADSNGGNQFISAPHAVNQSFTGLSLQSANVAASIGASGTGIAVRAAGTGISVNPANSAVSVASNGGGASHNNMPPSIVLNKFIRAE